MTPKKTAQIAFNIFTTAAKLAGTLSVPEGIFGVSSSERLLAQYVRVYLFNQRQGTRKTKRRGEVKSSTRKIYRQKGTGRARHGARSAPIFVGGGVAHGIEPKDFSLKLNKKQRRKALYFSLSLRARAQNISVISGLVTLDAKTKIIADMLAKLSEAQVIKNDTKNGRLLLICSVEELKSSTLRAFRNLDGIILTTDRQLNAYDVLQSDTVLFTEDALTDFISFRGFATEKVKKGPEEEVAEGSKSK